MRSEAYFLSCGGRRCGRGDILKRDKETKTEKDKAFQCRAYLGQCRIYLGQF